MQYSFRLGAVGAPTGSSGDVILECYQGNRGEFDVVEDLEMLVIGYQVFCLTTNCTINKLVIVRIACNQIESPYWGHTNEVLHVEQGLDNSISKEWGGLCGEYFLVLHQYFVGNTDLDFVLQKISPNLMVWTLRRKDCQKAISVENNSSHHLTVL